MFYARKWLTGPCVPLSYKNSIWITTVSSQNYLWRSCWGSDTGRDHGRVTLHQQKVYFFFRETTWGSEEVTKQAPAPPTDSVGKWGWCRFHSTLGQTRNHSPECKPPILQDVGNLEQETAVTHTLTSLSLTPCSLGWGTERLQNMETVLPPQVCTKPYTPDDHRSGEGILHFNIFARNPFFFIESVTYTQH